MIYPQPRPRPKALQRKDAKRDTAKIDKAERAKCRQRSGGQCEVMSFVYGGRIQWRCKRRATENDHLLGGMGRRNRGRSILAEHRLDVCSDCHRDITQHVLVPIGPDAEYAASVRYERRV